MAGDRGPLLLSWPVAIILGLIVLARCAFIVGTMARSGGETWINWVMASDSRDYAYAANDYSDRSIESVSFRTPLYPLFLAATSELLQPRWLLPVVLQQLAVGLTAIACGIVASKACGAWSGRAAALIYALCPLAVTESVVILPDILMACSLAWAGVVWLNAVARLRGKELPLAGSLFSGLLLSVATMLKPSCSFAFAVPLAQLLLLKGIPAGRKALVGLVILMAALSLPVAWRAHNLVRFGSPVLTTQDSFELAGRFLVLSGRETLESFWLESADSLEFIVSQGPIMYQDLACTKVPGGWAGLGGGRFCPSIDVGRRDSLFRSVAISTFMQAPLRIVLGHFTKWPLFLANPVGDLSRAGTPPMMVVVARASSMAVQIALALGALLALAQRRVRAVAPDLLVFSALTFLVTGVVAGPLAGTRYSLPFYWALVSVASCGWMALIQSLKPYQAKRAAGLRP
jgi:hypothetical protein